MLRSNSIFQEGIFSLTGRADIGAKGAVVGADKDRALKINLF